MAKTNWPNVPISPDDDEPRDPRGPRRPIQPQRPGWGRLAVVALVAFAFAYGMYFWFGRAWWSIAIMCSSCCARTARAACPGDQIIVPRPPEDRSSQAYAEWEATYGDCNGILEQVYPEGTYFGFSPFDYERDVVNISTTAIVSNGKVGIVVRKFGRPLDAGQVLAGPGQRGPMPGVLEPARYNEYANPHATRSRRSTPSASTPGTTASSRSWPAAREGLQHLPRRPRRAGRAGQDRAGGLPLHQPLREAGDAGHHPIASVTRCRRPAPARAASSDKDESIRFPSADSFEIRMEGFVEWSIIPERLPLIYTQYAEGAGWSSTCRTR
jgi:hypothetical protein